MRFSALGLGWLLGLALLAVAPAGWTAEAPRMVRVGAFNYYPAIFPGEAGTAQGFYVDMLEEVAKNEHWQIEYRFGSWSEGLERLKSGEVDVLTSVAYTEERATFVDYGRIPLLTVWGELYVPADSTLDSISKIEGKTIALMRGDFSARHFVDQVQKFGFRCKFVEFADFDQVFTAVRRGEADGGVANVVFGSAKKGGYALKATGVMFNPFDIYFAVAKGSNADLLATLDRYLDSWRRVETSVYHQSRLKWSDAQSRPTEVLPAWVFQGAAGLGLLVLISLVFNLLLRRQVRRNLESLAQKEAKQQQSTQMIHLLLDSTAEAIYGLDLEGLCTFCNAACVKTLGYDNADRLIGQNMHRLIHHRHADCSMSECFQLEAERHVVDELLWRADGSSFSVEYWSYPMRRDGRLVGAVVTFIDITERRQVEAALQQKTSELERFVYTLSHDLKSPLVTIKSFLGLLEQDMAANDAQEIAKDLGYIKAAADNMGNLIEDLLQLSRAGRQLGQPVAIGFQQLVRQSLAALAGRFVETAVTVEVADADLLLYGDPVRLGQIWSNLIDNAVKYRGVDSLTIVIGMTTEGKERIFFVRDNGMGIDPAHAETIFDLFAQLDGRSDGSGLGLALVKKIVELYQGRIWVTSAGSGQGCCFQWTLPQAVAPIAQEAL